MCSLPSPPSHGWHHIPFMYKTNRLCVKRAMIKLYIWSDKETCTKCFKMCSFINFYMFDNILSFCVRRILVLAPWTVGWFLLVGEGIKLNWPVYFFLFSSSIEPCTNVIKHMGSSFVSVRLLLIHYYPFSLYTLGNSEFEGYSNGIIDSTVTVIFHTQENLPT